MKFEFSTAEVQKQAKLVIKHYRKQALQVSAEKRISDEANYVTTLTVADGQRTLLVDAQPELVYHKELQDFARWLRAERINAELLIAAPEETTVQANSLEQMKADGVGLLLITGSGKIKASFDSRNPALMIHVAPDLVFGKKKESVEDAVRKFNFTNRADGFRDLCDLVENATDELIEKECTKNKLTMTQAEIDQMDWATKINTLASDKAHGGNPAQRVVSEQLKDDLHSFRNSRNLFKHPVKSPTADANRHRQLTDKMMLGLRLMHEIDQLKRKVK